MAKDILIVDDDVKLTKVLKQYAENMGCFNNIIVANDGGIAATKISNQKFDVILLDLTMPKRSGLDVLEEFAKDKRALNNASKVIIVSGNIEKAQLEKILALGCKNFLIKPFDEAAFQEKILKFLGTKP